VSDGRLSLTVVTPEHALLDGIACDEVTLPATDGEIGILPGHTPLITLLGIGVVAYKGSGSGGRVAVREGFAEISSDVVRILADRAAKREDVDVAGARAEREAAEKAHLTVVGEEQLAAVNADQEYAEARLKVAQ
jgi:F-type H+-transporting ATPase subunit epsilon